jgi:hypothetical protein
LAMVVFCDRAPSTPPEQRPTRDELFVQEV